MQDFGEGSSRLSNYNFSGDNRGKFVKEVIKREEARENFI